MKASDSPPTRDGKPPPILLLIVDCLRADRAFAQARLEPEGILGRLVRSGRSFHNAVTVTPTTTPAVASMLTGRYPFEHGLRGLAGFSRPREVETIARALADRGYRTEADVSGPLQPELRLFDEFDDYVWHEQADASIHGPRGNALVQRLRALRERSDPWFYVFHVWDLHEPRQVPADFDGPALGRTVYDRALGAADRKLGELLSPDLLDGVATLLVGDHGENLRLEPRRKLGKVVANLLWWKPSRWAAQPLARRLIARGARSSSKRALRLAPRAVITHGHHLFEPLLRVPYILVADSVRPGLSRALVTHTDIAPTLVGLAGGWVDGGIGAVGLPLEGDGDPERRVVIETAWVTSLPGIRQIGVRTPRWKYMSLADGGAAALFDLVHDPAERRNVVNDFPDVAKDLREELELAFENEIVGAAMSEAETEIVERRLKDLGYFN